LRRRRRRHWCLCSTTPNRRIGALSQTPRPAPLSPVPTVPLGRKQERR
jgi:hypothetical protein